MAKKHYPSKADKRQWQNSKQEFLKAIESHIYAYYRLQPSEETNYNQFARKGLKRVNFGCRDKRNSKLTFICLFWANTKFWVLDHPSTFAVLYAGAKSRLM
jgi:hypothetical protein